jgi:hypothetical protein
MHAKCYLPRFHAVAHSFENWISRKPFRICALRTLSQNMGGWGGVHPSNRTPLSVFDRTSSLRGDARLPSTTLRPRKPGATREGTMNRAPIQAKCEERSFTPFRMTREAGLPGGNRDVPVDETGIQRTYKKRKRAPTQRNAKRDPSLRSLRLRSLRLRSG